VLSDAEKEGLGVAFNEATLLGAEVERHRQIAAITLSVLTLPPEGPSPDDPRLQLLLHGVRRVAASLRMGNWNDPEAPVQAFQLSELLAVVQSFGGCPIYGWEFFDIADEELTKWHGKFSLDVQLSEAPAQHSLSLFQEGGRDRHLDMCFWFQELEIRSAQGNPVALEEVIDSGRRWWDAFYRNDPRTTGLGIIPLK